MGSRLFRLEFSGAADGRCLGARMTVLSGGTEGSSVEFIGSPSPKCCWPVREQLCTFQAGIWIGLKGCFRRNMTLLHAPSHAALPARQAPMPYSSRTGGRLKSESRMIKEAARSMRPVTDSANCGPDTACTRLFLLAGFGISFSEIGEEDIQHAVFVLFLHGAPSGDQRIPGLALLGREGCRGQFPGDRLR